MPIRTALALLLLLPVAAPAQELDLALRAVVKISGTRNGQPVQGSGFVVGLEPGKATIVTASHLIEGLQEIKVIFAAAPTERFPAKDVLGRDRDNPNGLATFLVRGEIPAAVSVLSFDAQAQLQRGEDLFLLGFPQMALSALTLRAAFAGPSGNLLQLDRGVDEGISGGPVLRKGGRVVGVVMSTDSQLTFALSGIVASDAVVGWLVKVGASCKPGDEKTIDGIEFVHICAGTFIMGSKDDDPQADADEKPAHQVTLTEFWIGKYEITNAQYQSFKPDHQGEPDLPVTSLNWAEAEATCRNFGGRLPTEAEWEYAARAGNSLTWSFGDNENLTEEYAWYDKNSGLTAHIVGKKKPNNWGLYDMHGNVWEWVADWYGPYPNTTQNNPTGVETGKYRVVRDGPFIYKPRDLRSANRSQRKPSVRDWLIGFRCVIGPSSREL